MKWIYPTRGSVVITFELLNIQPFGEYRNLDE
jgi:hypothetical protein